MKIYYQTNNNDCGISVTQSLINYFFNQEISKEELYQESNIKEEGLSILDLELLNKKYGLKLESYSMSFEEFRDYKIKDFFLLVINRNGEQHYTIAKKNSKGVTLYDPALGKIKVSMEDLKTIWLDIFITVTRDNQIKASVAGKQKFRKDQIDRNRVLVLLLINILVLSLSVVNTYLLRYSFNYVYSNNEYSNILKVLIFIAVFYATFHLGEYIESCFICKHRIKYTKDLQECLIDSLSNKRNSYFQKLGKNQFLLLKDHVDCIASYHSEYVNKALIGLFTLVVLGFFLVWKNTYFIILIFFSAFVQLLFWKLSRNNYYKYFPVLNELQNKGKKLLYSLESLLHREANVNKLSILGKEFKDTWNLELNNHEELAIKDSLYSKLNSYLNNFLYIVLFGLVAYSISKGDQEIVHLMVMNAFYFHLSKAFSSIMSFYGYKIKYDYSSQIYSQLLNVDNFEVRDCKEINPPQEILIKNLFYASSGKVIFKNLNLAIPPNTLICGPSGVGKSVLYKLIVRKLNPSIPCIYFDHIETSEIDSGAFRDLCIYQISDSYIANSSFDLENLCPNLQEEILSICDSMNLPDCLSNLNPESLSSGQKQLINILDLLKYKNKILLLDEIASHINIDARIRIYQHIIPYIATKNFVVCSEHSPEIIPLFTNVIDLCTL